MREVVGGAMLMLVVDSLFLIAIVAAATLDGSRVFSLFFVGPTLLLLWAVAVLYVVVLFGLESPRALAGSILVAALTAMFVVPNHERLYWTISADADVTLFLFLEPGYDATIAAMPGDPRTKYRIFEWGGFIAMSRGVVYDGNDHVWRNRKHHLPECMDGLLPIVDHYYFSSFSCGP